MTESNNGHFVWHEHLTKDTAAAIAFYGEVAGWKTEPFGSCRKRFRRKMFTA